MLGLVKATTLVLTLCSSLGVEATNSKYVNIVPGIVFSSQGNLHPTLKDKQFDFTYMNEVLDSMVSLNNNVLVIETPYVDKESLIEKSLGEVALMQGILNKASDSFATTAIPLDNYIRDVADSFYDIHDLEHLEKVVCDENEPCVVVIRATNASADLIKSIFERISAVFGSKHYHTLWTTKRVKGSNLVTLQHNEGRYLSRNRRSVDGNNNNKAVRFDKMGYSTDYKLLSPALIQGLIVGFIFISLFIMGVMGMVSLQAPVRYQDAKIPTVGKE